MSWMMEQSEKQCQCECWKGKLRRWRHRKRERMRENVDWNWADLIGEQYLASDQVFFIKDDFVMSCLTRWSRWTGCPAFFFLFPVSCPACGSLWQQLLAGWSVLSTADHTVISSAAAHLKRHPEHLTILEACSLKYLDRERVLGGGNAGGVQRAEDFKW